MDPRSNGKIFSKQIFKTKFKSNKYEIIYDREKAIKDINTHLEENTSEDVAEAVAVVTAMVPNLSTPDAIALSRVLDSIWVSGWEGGELEASNHISRAFDSGVAFGSIGRKADDT